MRNKIFLCAAVILMLGCGQLGQKAGAHTNNADTLTPVKNAVNEKVSAVQYKYKPDLKTTPWQGNLMDAAYWKDRRGENIVIISELPQYFWKDKKPEMEKYLDDKENTEVAELFAYHYVYNAEEKKWKIYWTLNDFKFSNCDVIMEYLPGTLAITDLDSDGNAESIFSYYYALCDQANNLDYNGKLILHIDSLKYSIKGMIGLYRNQVDSVESNKYYDNFSGLSPMFKTYAGKAWQKAIGIRDSLDKELEKKWNK